MYEYLKKHSVKDNILGHWTDNTNVCLPRVDESITKARLGDAGMQELYVNLTSEKYNGSMRQRMTNYYS